MTLKVGTKGYLQLGLRFEEPRWREALVIGLQTAWLQCLVRCSKEEAANTQLTTLEVSGETFCLVEAGTKQLLSGVTEESMPLEVSSGDLLKAGLAIIRRTSCITPLHRIPARRGKGQRKRSWRHPVRQALQKKKKKIWQ